MCIVRKRQSQSEIWVFYFQDLSIIYQDGNENEITKRHFRYIFIFVTNNLLIRKIKRQMWVFNVSFLINCADNLKIKWQE